MARKPSGAGKAPAKPTAAQRAARPAPAPSPVAETFFNFNPTPNDRFIVGDVVQLKSGGPALTVVEKLGHEHLRVATCAPGCTVGVDLLPAQALRHWPGLADADIPF